MNTTAATDFMTDNKGTAIIVCLVDGTEVTGDALSVNSKGVNIKVDGKTRSFGLARISDLWTVEDRAAELEADDEDLDDDDSDLDEDGDDFDRMAEIMELLHDDMTTAELAEIMDTTPKLLRVSLRALGMGVGKGRKYALTPSAYTAVKNHLDAAAKAAAAN